MPDQKRDEPGRPAAGQAWNAKWYAAHARFVTDLGANVLEMLAAKPGERILDLGCGDGVLTRLIADQGADVLGLDPDPDFIKAARAAGVKAVEGDGQALTFDAEFDAVFSNAALHWMPKPDQVAEGVARALKPGGRFVAEQGGFGNIAAIAIAMAAALEAAGHPERTRLPWSYPSPAEQTRRLEQAGFQVEIMELIPRPTLLPTGMTNWFKTFANPYLAGLPDEAAAAIRTDAIRRLAPSLRDSDGHWVADYVRLRFQATKRAT